MSVTVPFQRGRDAEVEPEAPESGRVPHRTLILAAAALVLLAAVGTWLVAFSAVFGVKTVTVRGTTELTPAAVRSAADIKTGTPLLRLDTGAVARRIEALPDVASVAVQTHLPSTVVISVTERIAVGYLEVGNDYVLVDKTGDQFRRSSSKPSRLPLFAVPSGTTARATGQAVATVAASLPRSLLAKVASIQAFDPTAITLLLQDHRVVRWGSDDCSADKARILPTLLKQPGTQYDVTNPNLPFTH
jgi:cell division protein FtsQ